MTKPEELKQTDKLPDDLKAMLAEMKVPTSDPVIPLMAWIWKQMSEAKGTLEIEVPCLTEVTRNKLQMSNLTVSKGCTSPEVHLLDRSRCQTFHGEMAAQFEKAKGVILP